MLRTTRTQAGCVYDVVCRKGKIPAKKYGDVPMARTGAITGAGEIDRHFRAAKLMSFHAQISIGGVEAQGRTSQGEKSW